MKASRCIAALVLFVPPLLLFWRRDGFFIQDDWRAMILAAQTGPATFVLAPEGEQWFPFFHAVFYGLLRVLGTHYAAYTMISALLVGASGVLLWTILRRHFAETVPWILALTYVSAPVHFATVPIAFYICYHLSLIFFLAALMWMFRFLETGDRAPLLLSVLCMALSVTSHNFTWAALPACAASAGLLSPGPGWRRIVAAGLATGLIMVLYLCVYCLAAGADAATSLNPGLLTEFPLLRVLRHMLGGAIAAPAFYLAWHQRLPITPMLAVGLVLFAVPAAVVLGWGDGKERRILCWAVAMNLLFLLPVAFSRWHFGWGQSTAPRYGVFTLVGSLFVCGAAWSAAARRWSVARRVVPALAIAVLGAQACLRWMSPPEYFEKYRAEGRAAREFCRVVRVPAAAWPAEPVQASRAFLLPDSDLPVLTWSEYSAVRRFLDRTSDSPEDVKR